LGIGSGGEVGCRRSARKGGLLEEENYIRKYHHYLHKLIFYVNWSKIAQSHYICKYYHGVIYIIFFCKNWSEITRSHYISKYSLIHDVIYIIFSLKIGLKLLGVITLARIIMMLYILFFV